MLINDLSETSPRRRRIIQQPLRTEPPIALIGGDGRANSELETLLKRGHPLITFPSLSHFLAEPPRPGGREGWAAIVMARASAWDVRLTRYVSGRRCIALFAQPEEGYGWPEDVTRLGELSEVDAWLARLKEPEPISVLKKAAPRAPRKPKPMSPAATPSWLQQDARVWNAVTSTATGAAAETSLAEPPAVTAAPASRRPPEQLTLGDLGGSAEKRKQKRKTVLPPATRGPRTSARSDVRSSRKAHQPRAKAALPARPPARPELAPQRISELTRRLLKELRPLSQRDEIVFLQAAAEVGLLRANELLDALQKRAASLA